MSNNDFKSAKDAVLSYLDGKDSGNITDNGKCISLDDLGVIADLMVDESNHFLDIEDDNDLETIFNLFPDVAD